MQRTNGSGNSEHALLCLYYPQQLLPGLAAVLSFRRQQNKELNAPLTLLVWSPPNIEHTVWQRRLETFKRMLQPFAWVRLFFLEPSEIKAHLSQNIKVLSKASYLQKKFGRNSFTTIYYAHDISADFMAQSAMQAFPYSKRICFGDALGIVYSNDYFTNQTYPIGQIKNLFKQPVQVLRNIMFRTKRRWTLPPIHRRLNADYAVLILPCDPGGDFIKQDMFIQVDHDSLQYVLDNLSKAVEQSLTDNESLTFQYTSSNFVMLLGSFSESRLTTEEQECALYVKTAQLYVAPGSQIILKAHPASHTKKIKRIVQALSANYDVIVVDIGELPIEAIPWLIQYSTVLSFSYSSVSLLYLYGANVLHVMSNDFINEFFPQNTHQWLRESNDLYLEQLVIARDLRNKHSEIVKCQK